MSEDELLNREGISPQQYLEFTEKVVQEIPVPKYEEEFNYYSVAGEPGMRGEPGVIV